MGLCKSSLRVLLCLAVLTTAAGCDEDADASPESAVEPAGPSGGKGDNASDVSKPEDRILERTEIVPTASTVERIAGFDPAVRDRVANIKFEDLTYEVDGLAVKGFMLTPQTPGPHPAIIYNRGGNGEFDAIGESVLLFWISRFAQWGYVVVASQYRGNGGGEGAEEFGGDDVHDVLALIDILDGEPTVDSSRIGMYGHSRGGLMTYLALSQTDRISTAVVDAGVADSILWIEERPEIESVYETWVPDYATNREAALLARSPARWPERLDDVPILMLHGTDDIKVQISQPRAMHEGLMKAGRDVELVEYEGGGHSLGAFTDDVTERIRTQMDKHLR